MFKRIKEFTNTELEEELKIMYEMIYIVECYGSRDLVYFDLLEDEAIRRDMKLGYKLEIA